MNGLTAIDYTRTCDRCRTYVPTDEQLNRVRGLAENTPDGQLPFGWYTLGGFENRLCDNCYMCLRLEGRL